MNVTHTNMSVSKKELLLGVQNESLYNKTSESITEHRENLSNSLIVSLFSVGGLEFLLNAGILASLLSRTSDKRIRTLKQHLIAIATNDVLTSLATILMGTIDFAPIKHDLKLCATITVTFITSQLATILTVLMIGIKRFIAVKKATRLSSSPAPEDEKPWTNIASVCGIWIFSVAFYVTAFIPLSAKSDHIDACYFEPLLGPNLQKFGALITIASFLSLAAVDVIYVITVCMLQRSISQSIDVHNPADSSRKTSSKSTENSRTSISSTTYEKRSKASTCSTSSSVTENKKKYIETIDNISEYTTEIDENLTNSSQEPPVMPDIPSKIATANAVFEKRLRKLQLRGVVTLGLVLLAVNVLTLPFVMVGILKAVIKVDLSKSLTVGINAFMSLNALMDPFVYCFRVEEVRKGLTSTFRKLCCCVCHIFCAKRNRDD